MSLSDHASGDVPTQPANNPKLSHSGVADARTFRRLPGKPIRLQRFLARGFGLRPSRFGKLREAVACCGTDFSPRLDGCLRCFGATLLRPPGTLGSSDLGPGGRTHLSAPADT